MKNLFFFKRVEIINAKGEIAQYEKFLLQTVRKVCTGKKGTKFFAADQWAQSHYK